MTTVALGEVVDFYSGGTPSKSNHEFWAGNVPWFSAKDLKKPRLDDSSDHITEDVFRATPLRKLPAGTIAMVVRGMILAHTVPISILDVDAAINQDLKALLPKREVDTSFLAAMLRAQHTEILSKVSTAAHGTKKLDSRVLEELRIPFPHIQEQRRIAAILDHANLLRAKRRQTLAHLDSLTQAIFHDMFGSLQHGEQTELAKVAYVKGGKRLPKGAQYAETATAHPYIRVTDLRNGRVRTSELCYLTPDVHREIARYTVDRDDVLISIAGSIGLTAVVPGELAGANLTENAAKIVAKDDSYTGAWLASALQTPAMQVQIAGKVGQVTIGKLALFRIEQLKLRIPPIELQHRFLDRIDKVRAHVELTQRASAADDELFASLQSRAFRGEL